MNNILIEGLDSDIEFVTYNVTDFKENRPTVIILSGIPASCKTTISEQYQQQLGFVRLNRDDYRKSLTGVNIKKYYEYGLNYKYEDLITNTINNQLEELIDEGEDVIIDGTNLNLRYIKGFLKLIKNNANIQLLVIKSDYNETLRRNELRDDKVNKSVIRETYPKIKQLINNLNKLITSDFDLSEWLFNQDCFTPVNQNSNNPKAVIFDIDGTLALRNDRSPFDWHKVKEDSLNKPVWLTYKAFQKAGYYMIIFTGRDGVCEYPTKEWLYDNDIQFDEFRIRPQNNFEKDSIIKRRFLEDIINDYYVEVVVDDRKQVKKMWNESGVFILDVNQTDETY